MLFTITFCMSALVAAVLFEFRDAVASFYSEEGLKTEIAIFAISFLLAPFAATISALLRREMAVDVLAGCGLTAAFVNTATSIVLTALGCGFMGPIFGAVVGQAALVVLFVVCRRDLRVFCPHLKGYRDVIGFGAYSSARAIINVSISRCRS